MAKGSAIEPQLVFEDGAMVERRLRGLLPSRVRAIRGAAGFLPWTPKRAPPIACMRPNTLNPANFALEARQTPSTPLARPPTLPRPKIALRPLKMPYSKGGKKQPKAYYVHIAISPHSILFAYYFDIPQNL